MKYLLIIIIFSFIFPLNIQAYELYDERQNEIRSTKEVMFYANEIGISEEESTKLIKYADYKGIPFQMVFNLLSVETGGTFHHEAIGPKTKYGRAYGIAQFMENTAPWIAKMANLPYKNKEDLFDASFSIKLSITYLHYLYYGGTNHNGYYDWHQALTAYNRGMMGMETFKEKTGSPVSSYSSMILNVKKSRF